MLVRGLIVALLAALASPCIAFQAGISGVSGARGDTCTDNCHMNGVMPDVAIEGPDSMPANSEQEFRVVLRAHGVRQVAGGFDVAASGGVLIATEVGTRLEAGELTHVAPRLIADINRDGRHSAADVIAWLSLAAPDGEAFCLAGDTNGDLREDAADLETTLAAPFGAADVLWNFAWRAPGASGSYKLFAAALSANCNGTRSGDASASTFKAITVLP
jgi:hypothetical protein